MKLLEVRKSSLSLLSRKYIRVKKIWVIHFSDNELNLIAVEKESFDKIIKIIFESLMEKNYE